MVKRQFGHVKVRYRGLKKNTLQLKGAVCAVELVDAQAPNDGNAGMSAFKAREIALNRAKKRQCYLKDGSEKPKLKTNCLI